MSERSIMIISGTNRPGSNTLKVSRLIERIYSNSGRQADVYDLADLPREVFEPTVYASKPPTFQVVQQRVIAAAGLHVVLPEYNGSFPGILKYFIDLLKFPESFDRKPVAFTGISAGVFSALRPVEQLQMVFAYRNAHLYPERVFIAGIGQKLDAAGELTDLDLLKRLTTQAEGFARFADVLGKS
jgi:chromate reductase